MYLQSQQYLQFCHFFVAIYIFFCQSNVIFNCLNCLRGKGILGLQIWRYKSFTAQLCVLQMVCKMRPVVSLFGLETAINWSKLLTLENSHF